MPNNSAVTNLIIKITANAGAAIQGLKALEGQVAASSQNLQKASQRAILGEQVRGQDVRRRMLLTQAEFEYRQGLKSAAQVKTMLGAELREYEAFSAKWAAVTRKLAQVDALEARKGRAATREEHSRGAASAQAVGHVSDAALTGGAAVLGGLGYAATQAAKFTSEMTKARNNTQMTDQEFQVFQQHALDLGKTTGASVDQIGQAFMRAKNHGLDMKTTLAVVDAATKSAVATGSDVGETANVLSQTMHIFHISGDQAAQTMNTLHQASLQGNMTMSELVEHFGLAEAVTSKYGLTLQDTAAAFATMTENGLNAAEAGTQVRDVMQHLTHVLKPAQEEIERLSKSTGVDLVGDIQALQNGTGSLTKFMIDLNAATHGQATEINKIIPAQRGAFGAMALTGKAAVDLKNNYDQLVLTQNGKLDPTTAGFNRTLGTLDNQIARVNNTLLEMYVKVGPKLIPILQDAVKGVGELADDFNRLSPEAQNAIVKMLEYGGALLVGVGALGKLYTGVRSVAEIFGALRTAALGAETAQGAVAVTGLRLFAAGAPYLIALAALAALVLKIKDNWDKADAAQQLFNRNGTQKGAQTKLDDAASFRKMAADEQAGIDTRIKVQRMGGVVPWLHLPMDKGSTLGDAFQEDLKERYARLWADNAQAALLEKSASVDKHNADGGEATDTGMKIGLKALERQKEDAHQFHHKCQSLARSTVEDITTAFDGVWDRSPNASAKSNLARFQAKGLAKPYVPGMNLAPGSLLYSDTLGGDSGHVQTVGPHGERLDQYGVNHFAESNFQFYVPPPTGAARAAAGKLPGGVSTFGPDPKEAAKAAKQLESQRADARTILANAAVEDARAVYRALLGAFQDKGGDMSGAQRAALVARLKAQASHVESLENRSAGTALAGDKASPAAQAQYKADLASNARDHKEMLKAISDAERQAIDDAQKKRDEAEKKKREAERKALEAVKKQQEYELRGLEIARDAATTDAERQAIGDKIFGKKMDIALTGKHLDADADDHETRAAAARSYAFALRDLNAEHAQEHKDFDNSARQRAVELLKAQADATTDLAAKNALLYEAEEKQLALASADDRPLMQAEVSAARRARTRDLAEHNASDALESAVYGDRHGLADYRTLSQATDKNRDPSELGASASRQVSELLEAVGTARTNSPDNPALALDAVLPRIKELFAQASDAKDLHAIHEMQGRFLDFWEKAMAPDLEDIAKLPKKQRDADFDAMIAALADAKGPAAGLPPEVAQAMAAWLRGEKSKSGDKKGKAQDADWSDYRRGMTKTLGDSADEASKTFLLKLLSSGKEKKGALQGFWQSMTELGKQELTKLFYDQVLKKAFSSIFDTVGSSLAEALKGGGAGLIKDGIQFALIVGAAMNLSGKNGKKKQSHSIFGAILGGIAGSFLGQAGTGAEIGANLGGMFAAGGRPPLGVPSLVGERGPELFVPDMAGTIIPSHRMSDIIGAGGYAPRSGAALAAIERASFDRYTNKVTGPSAQKDNSGVNITLNSSHYGDIHSGIDVENINANLTKQLTDKIRM